MSIAEIKLQFVFDVFRIALLSIKKELFGIKDVEKIKLNASFDIRDCF